MATNSRFPEPQTMYAVPPPDPAALLEQMVAENKASIGSRYMPTLTVKQFSERESMLNELKSLLKEGIDYGTIPGTPKPTLYKPGAEKICAFFGYAPHYTESLASIEDWEGDRFGEPLFYYKYACTLEKDGKPVGEGVGSANSWESKYRYRWVKEHDIPPSCTAEQIAGFPRRDGGISEFTFAVDKAETSGPYGKPAEYWQKFKDAIANKTARKGKKKIKSGEERDTWEILDVVYRVPNPEFADLINTVQKMGQKRAYIAATLSATGASQYFTQDLEDIPSFGEPNVAQQEVATRRIEEERGKVAAAKQEAPRQAPAPFAPTAAPAAAPAPAVEDMENIPEELHHMFQHLEEKGMTAQAMATVKENLIMAKPQTGLAEWSQLLAKHGIKPRGNTYSSVRALLLDAFQAAQDAPALRDAYSATDDDIPTELFEKGKEPSYGVD